MVNDTSGVGAREVASIRALNQRNGVGNITTSGELGFFISDWNSSTLVQAMRIDRSGRVGIGTINPGQTLDVVGRIRSSTGAIFNGTVDINTTTGALIWPRMTTVERDALTAVVGMTIWNTSDTEFQNYDGTAWGSFGGGSSLQTDADNNTAYGLNAGLNTFNQNVGGLQNTFIGSGAGSATTSQDGVIAIGYNAAPNAAANGAIIIGNSAGDDTNASVVLGHGASSSGTTSTAVVIGAQALNTGTTTQSVLIGNQVAQNASGLNSSNVIIGSQTSTAISGANGNVLIGASLGSNMTSSSLNTIIGNNAGDQLTNGISNVLIGPNVGNTSGNFSNRLMIDNSSTNTPLIDGNFTTNEIKFNTTITRSQSDVYIEDIGKGVIMKSPDGTCWRFTPDNSGALTSTSVTCP